MVVDERLLLVCWTTEVRRGAEETEDMRLTWWVWGSLAGGQRAVVSEDTKGTNQYRPLGPRLQWMCMNKPFPYHHLTS